MCLVVDSEEIVMAIDDIQPATEFIMALCLDLAKPPLKTLIVGECEILHKRINKSKRLRSKLLKGPECFGLTV